ncbi:hypothetical protein ACFFRR_010366 [Megaselia abdita]
MKHFLLLLCLTVPTIYGSFNVSQICEVLSNGVKFQDPSNCSQWYDCTDGVASQPSSCVNGTYFDKHNQTCVSQSEATCNQDLCTIQTNGFIADPTSCSTYFYCSNGKSNRGVCAKDYNFNPIQQVCSSPLAYECTNNTLDYEQLCLLIPDNIFIADTDDCQGWYTCKKNIPSKGQCPPGYLFDATTAFCNFTDNVNCGNRSTTSITTVQTPKPAGECSTPGTYISDNKTCNGFYYCYDDGNNGSMLLFGECNDEYFFDAAKGGCANRTQVDCTYNRCVGDVQWVSVAHSECKAYHKCANNYTGYCGEDYPYFDENTQQCIKTKIDYPSCV